MGDVIMDDSIAIVVTLVDADSKSIPGLPVANGTFLRASWLLYTR